MPGAVPVAARGVRERKRGPRGVTGGGVRASGEGAKKPKTVEDGHFPHLLSDGEMERGGKSS